LPSLTVENYVKAIYLLCSNNSGPATTGAIAAALQISPGSVTSMLKTLRESHLADYTPYGGVTLTENGEQLALRVLRRHRLIELFLVQTLHLSWDEVHEEAENMEHAVSDFLVDRIDQFLGHPAFDPHGDPIPKADGTVLAASQLSLTACPVNTKFTVQRVTEQAPDFLRYLQERGLVPNAEAQVVDRDSLSRVIIVRINDDQVTLSFDVGENIMVIPQS
jgi:DtxR family transcriptional regulator, Mn-dependent transcriptional regulator